MACVFCGGRTHWEDIYIPLRTGSPIPGAFTPRIRATGDRCENCRALTFDDRHNSGKIIQIKAPKIDRAGQEGQMSTTEDTFNRTLRAVLNAKAWCACVLARDQADKRFFERYGYSCNWPRGSVEDRKVWIKDYHHAKKLLLKAAAL